MSEAAPGDGPVKTAREKSFPCDACGAQLTFSIGAQQLRCDHCGAEKALVFEDGARVVERDLAAALRKQGAQRASATPTTTEHEVRCKSCGATVVFQGSLTSSECSYCGGPLQRESAHQTQGRLPVDGICPFAVERATAKEHLRRWVESRWFAPTSFTTSTVREKFDGVYIPYFTFDAMTFTRYRGERGDAYYVKEKHGDQERSVRKVAWSSRSGALQRFFDDVCIPALTSLPAGLLTSLEPWPLERVIPFTDQALAGKRAHTYEVELADSFRAARARMDLEILADVRGEIGGDEQRVHSVDTNCTALTYKHILLPAWILAYRFHGKAYRVVVNAMTGEVSGERPWSAPKIAAAVVVALAVLWVLMSMGGRQH